MKACVLHAVNDLRYEDVPAPTPKAGEALIKVLACGVCGSDIPRVFSKGTYHFPTIPGHEFAGEIVGVDEGVDAGLMGKSAAVFPLIPCRKCPPCEIGAFAQCENYDYLGSRSDGAFAEFVCAPVWNLAFLPENVSYEEAAMAEPAAVAAHALRRAQIDVGDTVLIFGAGPIGLLIAMWARIWGAGKVGLVDIDPEKLEFAGKQGFTWLIDPREQGVVAKADVVVEASGSSAAFEQCVTCARTFGKVVLLGNPAGEMKLSQKAYWAILRNELKLLGSWNSAFSNLPKNEWRLVLEFMASKRLDVRALITHRVGLEELPGAMEMMRDRTGFFNKVMYVSE